MEALAGTTKIINIDSKRRNRRKRTTAKTSYQESRQSTSKRDGAMEKERLENGKSRGPSS